MGYVYWVCILFKDKVKYSTEMYRYVIYQMAVISVVFDVLVRYLGKNRLQCLCFYSYNMMIVFYNVILSFIGNKVIV